MCNSPVNRDREMSFLPCRFLLIHYALQYFSLLHHFPFQTHSVSGPLCYSLCRMLPFRFPALGLVVFFSLSRLILVLNLSYSVLIHFSPSCYLQIYMYFQFINSPQKRHNQLGHSRFLQGSISFNVKKRHQLFLQLCLKVCFYNLLLQLPFLYYSRVIFFSIVFIDCSV